MNSIAESTTSTSLTTNYSAVNPGLVLIISEPPVSRVIGGQTVTVDAQDAHLLDEYGWFFDSGYVKACVPGHNRQRVRLHNLILPAPAGLEVDHRDQNTCNNTRANLRLATHGQNMANRRKFKNSSSPYKGVSFHKLTGKWSAKITENRRLRYIGLYADPVEAARAWDREAERIHGDFAHLNFATRTNV
jgi:hypothetical protein